MLGDPLMDALALISVAAVVAFCLAALSLMGPPDETISPSPIAWRIIKAVLRWRNRK